MKHGVGPQLCMANMECLAGFEPVPSAWKAEMLPLNTTDTFPYGASLSLVWDAGIEPAWIYPADFEAAASTCFANPRCPSDPFLTGRCDMIFFGCGSRIRTDDSGDMGPVCYRCNIPQNIQTFVRFKCLKICVPFGTRYLLIVGLAACILCRKAFWGVKEKEKENVIADDLQECAISQRNMHTTGMLFIFEMAWSCWTGSNRRPVAYEATALPTELHQQRGVQSVGVAPTSRQVRNRALHMLPLDIHPLLGETGGNWGKRNEKRLVRRCTL